MIACHVCGRESPDWRGLHKHIRAHGMRASEYYTKFPMQLRTRIFESVRYELVRDDLDIGPCWVWTGLQSPQGYGRMRVAGFDTCAVHRISYRAHGFQLTDEFLLLHTCDHPPCCNPAHLTPGTSADNNYDRAKKNRSHRILTDKQVFRVRELLSRGWPFERIRDDTGAALGSIAQIRDWRSHMHVTRPCTENEIPF